MDKLDELLSRLKTERVLVDQTKDDLNTMIAVVKNLDEYKNVSELKTKAEERLDSLEKEIKAFALASFAETGNKKPHEKLSVKIYRKFKVVDPNKMLAWVKTNLADALIVDSGKVKDYATKIGAVDGTEIVEEAQAQIASEL